MPSPVTLVAQADHRARLRTFGIRRRDRRSHMYVIGKSGTGKSHLLRTLMVQDLLHGEGAALIDPHGDLVEEVALLAEKHRGRDTVYLNTPDQNGRWRFNPFAGVGTEQRSLAAAGIIEVFQKLWSRDWGPRLEHLLRNVVFTLLEVPGATLGNIPRLLTDRDYRRDLVRRISNEEVKAFWTTEYDRYSPAFRAVVAAPLQNKVGAFLTDPAVRSIVTAKHSSFDLHEIMDRGKVLLVNLSKGQIGEGPATLLGSLLVSHIALQALARADRGEEFRRDFWLYLDEFQTFSTLSLATMLAELRKYRVGLVLAHQYLSQLDAAVRDAVIGNAGTIISFRVGAKDAPLIAAEFSPTFEPDDLINLPNFHIYLRLMIDGQVSRPFSAQTLASLP